MGCSAFRDADEIKSKPPQKLKRKQWVTLDGKSSNCVTPSSSFHQVLSLLVVASAAACHVLTSPWDFIHLLLISQKQLRHLCVLNIFCQPLQIIIIHLIAQKHLNWFHLQLRSLEGILCSMIARIHWLPFGCGQWKMLETSHIGVKRAKWDYFSGPPRSCGMLTAFADSQPLPKFWPFNSTEFLPLLPSGNFLTLSFLQNTSTYNPPWFS